MNLAKYLKTYINDDEYKIIITLSYINIKNYLEIKDYSSNKIVIKNKNSITIINGSNLLITKMIDKELLITGKILSIEL